MQAPAGPKRRSGAAGLAALGVLMIVTVSWFALAPPTMAATDLALQAAPSSVAVAAGDEVPVRLILTNSTAVTATVTAIDIPTASRVTTQLSGLTLPVRIPAAGALTATLAVRAEPGVRDGDIAVVATYRTGRTVKVMTASVTVKAVDSKPPEVTLLNVPSRLDDGQDGPAMVRISSPSGFAYRDVRVSPLNGDDVGVVRPGGALPSPFVACGPTAGSGDKPLACLPRLESGQTLLLPVRIKAHDSVQTGTQQVGVALNAIPDTPRPVPPVAVSATASVELAVFGVDALSPFGIGTLFLIPGFVSVLVFLLLARAVYPRAASLPDTIDLKDLRAMPIVVPAAALAYLAVWLIWGHNLTRAVSTADVAALFGIAFLFGLAAWGVIAVAWWQHSGRKKFDVGDGVTTVLRRLRARDARLTLPEFTLGAVRYLQLARAEEGTVLATPAITYAFTPKMQADDAGRAAFKKALDRDDIAEVLRAQKAGEVELRSTAGTGVRKFETKDADPTGTGPLIDEVQPDETH